MKKDNQLSVSIENIIKGAVQQVEEQYNKTLELAGVEKVGELIKLNNSRYNDILKSIPLADWCKDHNKNRNKLFAEMDDCKYIDGNNGVEPWFIELVHDLEVDEDNGAEISLSDLAIFNTNLNHNGKYTVMINPSSPHYDKLKELLYSLPCNGYTGSKKFDATKVCTTMRHLCPRIKIVI